MLRKQTHKYKKKGHFLFVISWFALEYFFFHEIYFSLASACEKGDLSNKNIFSGFSSCKNNECVLEKNQIVTKYDL